MPSSSATLPRLDLPIAGMTCASCAGRVERALAKVKGVGQVSVNLASEQARVEAPTSVLPELLAAVSKAGYSVQQRTLELQIGGMTCASCAGRVERTLGKVAGVQQASVTWPASGHGSPHWPTSTCKRCSPRWKRPATTPAGSTPRARRATVPTPACAASAGRWSSPCCWRCRWWCRWWPAGSASTGCCRPGCSACWRRRCNSSSAPVSTESAWKALKAGAGNMDLLVALGTSAAYAFSVFMLLRHGAHSGGHLYFEGAASVITLVVFGKWLEARAKRGTTAAIRALMQLRPEQAHLLRDGREIVVAVEDIRSGDQLVVRPGERFPVDGECGRRRQRGRRVADHRREHAGGKTCRRPCHRRRAQRRRPADRHRDRGRRGHHARPHHSLGGERSDRQGADAAAGRPGVGDVRAGGDCGGARHLHRLAGRPASVSRML